MRGGRRVIRGVKKTLSPVDRVFRANIHNRFDIEVLDVETQEVKQKAQGLNTICDQLWTRVFSPGNYFNYIHYGSGSGTPSSSDTSLFSYLGGAAVSTANPITNMDWSNGVYSIQFSIQLAASTAVGKTITEVGIAHGSASTTLCTHAMLQDMNGNPISIEKTSTDIVNIYATVFIHFDPHGFDGGCIRLNHCTPSQYGSDFFMWLGGRYHENCLPNIANWIHGDTIAYDDVQHGDYGTLASYSTTSVSYFLDQANRAVKLSIGRLQANNGNIGGITLIDIGRSWNSDHSYHYTHLLVRPGGSWLPHSEITDEAIGTGDGSTKDFALDFPFARNVKVYVDGVEVPVASVDYAPNSTEWKYFMHSLDPSSTSENHIHKFVDCWSYFNVGTVIFYNPMWEIGIKTLTKMSHFTIYVSDDLSTWTNISSLISSNTIPDAYIHSKYWKIVANGSSNNSNRINTIAPPSTFTGKVLHLSEAPPSGSVITADYQSDCIAKDTNHVFDMTVTIQLGEYTEAQ